MLTSKEIEDWESWTSHENKRIGDFDSIKEADQAIADILYVFRLYESHEEDLKKLRETKNTDILMVQLNDERKKILELEQLNAEQEARIKSLEYNTEKMREKNKQLTQNVQTLRDGKKDIIKTYLENELKKNEI